LTPSTTGIFTQTDVNVSGSYEIKKVGESLFIVLSEDITNDEGPDLFLTSGELEASTLGAYDYNSSPVTDNIVLGSIISSGAGQIREIPITETELHE
jgi:hypothetical protein